MINTVTARYNKEGDTIIAYLVEYTDGKTWCVPKDEANSKYQEILEWVAEGNTITDNGGGE